MLVFSGGTIPFAVDERERAATGDPRPSIAQRYDSKDDYLAQVRAAGEKLVRQGYLLEEDIETSLGQAAKFWDFFVNNS